MNVDPTKICQIEILVSNIERSVEFYEKVFGWKRLPADLHEYVVLQVPEGCSFGVSLVPQTAGNTSASSRSAIYFKVKDPQKIVELAKNYGGKLRFGPKRLENYGNLYQIEDPDGQRFGLLS